jgi:ABC-type transport system involved in multi-copper enzyme maturation permease subunit
MNGVWMIATNTLRQTVRQRLFHNVAVFGVGMLLLSMVLGQITFGYPERVVRSIGLGGVAIALDLVALLVAVSLVHEEIDRKTLFVILTRPVSRWQYVLGRYLGLVAALALVLVGFGAVFLATLSLVDGTPRAIDGVALGMMLIEASVLGAFGLVLSTFSTPTLAAGIGLGFWVASSTVDDLLRLTAKADDFTRLVARALHHALPAFERFNFREAAIHDLAVPAGELAAAAAYGGLYAAGLVALAAAVLSRREMV